jgi:GTP-binding protein Era
MANEVSRCGYVAIVGRPNVGKSTLLNHLIQQKISITSRKAQTTRHNITGIRTQGSAQIIFVDTPGMHKKEANAVNRYMNRAALSATQATDLVVFVVDRLMWTEEDEMVLTRLKNIHQNVLAVINKVDQVEDKATLIPQISRISEKLDPAVIIPVSALKNVNLLELEKEIVNRLPVGDHIFPADQITDKSSRFLASELIREKIMRQLGAELPYQVTVDIEEFKEENGIVHIAGLILVEREGQKRIVIGEGGSRLKSIGQAARLDMETLLDAKVMLKLWVKVKSGWSDDDRALRNLGYLE